MLLGVVLALALSACARDPEPGTPAAAAEGARLMRAMSDTLAGANSYSFSTSERLETPGTAADRRELRFTRDVVVLRPNALHFHVRGAEDNRADVSAYYDGQTLSLRDASRGVWAATPVPATLDEMLDDVARRYSVPVPVADVIYSVPYDAFIGPDSTGGFAGRETLDGQECVRLAYTDEVVGVQLWIPSTGPALPRRVELTYKLVPGAPRARIDFTDWNLAPQFGDGTFIMPPGEPDAQVALEDLIAGVMSTGHGDETTAASPAADPAAQ
jgi:hypothetical protein